MTSYNPVVKNAAGGAILNVALEPRTPTGGFQANPTLATGDVKISIDGGSFANLGTLPTVTPASGKNVKIVLSQSETNGDNLVILFSDAAGDEWNDLLVDIRTVAANFDDINSAVAAVDGKVDTAQADLDILTGTDGATLATSQPNYAPSVAGDAMTLTSAYDFAKGTVAMTESYAANGAAPTPAQALMAIHQMLMQFGISGTSLTVKKLDNSTTAFVVTLDHASTPTSAVRT